MSALMEPKTGTKRNFLTAIKETLRDEMTRNADMVCIGEDVGLLGGAFGVTDGLLAEFGRARVIDAPISEALIAGAATGMALNGKTVMMELQFIDFISCGFDQIVNSMATFCYRTAGEVNLPIVMRGPAGAYGGGALYHSQMNEAWFCNSPGLKVLCPSTPYDAKGLLRSALRDGNPVLIYEIKELYRKRDIEQELPDDDYTVPIGKAAVRREGTDLTLVSYGQNVYHCLEAADALAKEGRSVEVIDLRSLVPLDMETVRASIAKTGRVVVVNEAPMTCGFAGEVVARISNECFELLDAPPLRLTRLDTPVPWAKTLETHVLPNTEKVLATARKVLAF